MLMTDIRSIPTSGPVRGTFHVPGSKSLTNRALVCASLAGGTSIILNASDSRDSALMANGLDQLGVLVRREGTTWDVEGGGKLRAPRYPIPVGNAGTTLRFLLALSSLAEGKTVLEGSSRMGERPNAELLEALGEAGIALRQDPMTSRYEVTGGGFRGGRYSLRQDRSSQFLSALLLIGPEAASPLEIAVEGPRISESYVRMTLDVMRAFGASVEEGEGRYLVSPGRYSACRFFVEPDASGASYGLAAAAITGGEVSIEGLRLGSTQGDAAFPRLLARMGCMVEERGECVRLTGARLLSGIDVDMGAMPDAVPTLAAVALFATTPSRIRNVAHLRFKESDRLEALATELQRLGGSVVLHEDGLEIRPAPLHGGRVATYNDHRMAMTAALIGLRVAGVEVENPGCVEKSFPRFWEELERIRPAAG
jgi:3-phosphoshikimate 1-carboxyvinyltransferase